MHDHYLFSVCKMLSTISNWIFTSISSKVFNTLKLDWLNIKSKLSNIKYKSDFNAHLIIRKRWLKLNNSDFRNIYSLTTCLILKSNEFSISYLKLYRKHNLVILLTPAINLVFVDEPISSFKKRKKITSALFQTDLKSLKTSVLLETRFSLRDLDLEWLTGSEDGMHMESILLNFQKNSWMHESTSESKKKTDSTKSQRTLWNLK